MSRFRTVLALLVLASIVVRLPGIDRPLVGNFATKSAVYAMIARNWALDRASLTRPTIDLAAGDGRSWHLMEWPVSAYLTALGWKTFGGSLDAWGRGVSILFAAGTVWLVALYARRRLGDGAALVAAGVVAFSPVSVVYGQCFMLEASVMFFTVATLYGFEAALRASGSWQAWAWLAAAAVALSAAVATKIYMLLLVPVLLVAAWEQRQALAKPGRFTASAFVLFAAACAPTAVWYVDVFGISPQAASAAEHHPLDRATIHRFPHPLLSDVGYPLRVVGDLATHVLTPIGLAVLLLGGAAAWRRMAWSHRALAAASASLLIALPLKFYAANYYYAVLLPALALVTGAACDSVVRRYDPSVRVQAAVAALGLCFAARYAIGPAFVAPAGDAEVEAAAAALRDRTTADEAVVTLHGSSVDLLYYCDRRGWALNAGDPQFAAKLDAAIAGGARTLIVADLAAAHHLPSTSAVLKSLSVVAAGADWQLLALPPGQFPERRAIEVVANSAVGSKESEFR